MGPEGLPTKARQCRTRSEEEEEEESNLLTTVCEDGGPGDRSSQ